MTRHETLKPLIYLSHCSPAMVNTDTGEILKVTCPSTNCSGLVPLINGRIAAHDGIVPGLCDWIGVRVVMDPGVAVTAPATGTVRRSS